MLKLNKNLREKINKNFPTLGEKFDSHNLIHQIFVLAIASYVLFLLSVLYFNSINVTSYASDTSAIVEKPGAVKFASDEVLIKVRKNAKSKIRENPADVGIESLNILNKEFKMKKIERVVRESKISRADADIFQWYKVKFDEPREEISSTQAEVNEQLIKDSVNGNGADNIINNPGKKTTGNLSKDRFFSRLAKYAKDASIEIAEPNYIVNIDQISTPSATPTSVISVSPTPTTVPLITPTITSPANNIPNDPYYSSLWGLNKINSSGAWSASKGSPSIIVAVADTGVDRNHEDLKDNMWVNIKEIPNNGVDDDGNGYVDDYYGCNFINMTNNVCGDPMDDHGHGTHVAGTIGARGNNTKGVVGVNWNSSIMAIKFLAATGGGGVGDGAKAIIYAADNGARVNNNSWGAGVSYIQVLHDAIEYAHSKNMVIVAAAGNSNTDVNSFSPASEANAISVAATDSNDQKASFSNYGTKIDVSAPGSGIISTCASLTGAIGGTNYCSYSGTSMAAPHVSGLAALILSKNPEFTNEDVRRVLRTSSDDLGSPGFDVYFGQGRINATKALGVNSVPSSTPTLTPTPSPAPIIDTDKDGFTDSKEQYMGTNPNLKCGINAYPPDFDNDKLVRIVDINAIVKKYFTTDRRYDFDGDGKVTITDINIEKSYYYKDCQ